MFDIHDYNNIVTYPTGVTIKKKWQIAETKTVSAIFVIPLSAKIMGQLQKPVEMLKIYPSVNLFLGDSLWTNIEMPSIAHCQTIAYVSKVI